MPKNVPATPTEAEVVGPQLDATEARRITDAIDALTATMDNAGEERAALMLAAYEGRAWLALGLGSWSEYVKKRAGMSRSNAYRLLDKARGEVSRAGQSDNGTLNSEEPEEPTEPEPVESPPPVQLTLPWAVPHSQEAARLAHDDIAAKLGVGAAKSFLRDELTRLSKGALAGSEPAVTVTSALGPKQAACPHPKNREDKKPYGVWCGDCRKKLR